MNDLKTIESLLDEIRSQYLEASRMATLAETAQGLRPADNIGEIIREARGKQKGNLPNTLSILGITLH